MHAITEIDEAGRLIVPKTMRDALHLIPGSRIHLDQQGDTIVLSSDEPGGKLVETHGFLVWHSTTPQADTIDILKVIEQDRQDRMRHVFGESPDL